MADDDREDDAPDAPEGEHVVDDSKLKLPDVKLADVKVATHEEDEEEVYKQYVLSLRARVLWALARSPPPCYSHVYAVSPFCAGAASCFGLLAPSGSNVAWVTSRS